MTAKVRFIFPQARECEGVLLALCRLASERAHTGIGKLMSQCIGLPILSEYAQVLKMLGNGRLEAQCFDGTKRLAHIRGKMRKKVSAELL